jgi:hypothetical protein
VGATLLYGAFSWVLCPFVADQCRGDWDSDIEAEAAAQAMEQGTDDALRRRVLAADARHVPGSALTRKTVAIHGGSLTT